jgi:flagellar hook assembly protein FlgD
VPEDNGGGSLVNRLYPNRPNPFNPRTSIRFSLASAGTAKLVIYDVTGREVRTLVNGPQTAGLHEVVWDGTRDDERALPSGVYWCRMTTAGFESNRRMIVLK